MKKQKSGKHTALQLINEVLSKVRNKKPSIEEMMREVKMMNFKIRPLHGDIFALASGSSSFLESLWRIGKIEEVVTRAMAELDGRERRLFFDYLEELENQIHDRFIPGGEHLTAEEEGKLRLIRLEIFREAKFKKNIN